MKRNFLIVFVLAFVLAGCSLWKPQTEYTALESGIRMTEWQMELQREYYETKPYLTQEQQQYMEEEVAPLLDRAKHMIGAYNMAVLEDERPIYTETEIRRLLSTISYRLLKPEEKEIENDN